MRLIDADALDEKLQALAERYAKQGRIEVANDYNFVATVIMTAPTIDTENPRPQGEWEEKEDVNVVDVYYTCSVCKEDFVTIDGTPIDNLWNYCPNCGAKMKGADDHA